jgi:hypothetical protein
MPTTPTQPGSPRDFIERGLDFRTGEPLPPDGRLPQRVRPPEVDMPQADERQNIIDVKRNARGLSPFRFEINPGEALDTIGRGLQNVLGVRQAGAQEMSEQLDTIDEQIHIDRLLSTLDEEDLRFEEMEALLDEADALDAEQRVVSGWPMWGEGMPIFPMGSLGNPGAEGTADMLLEMYESGGLIPESWAPVVDGVAGFNRAFAGILQIPIDVADQALGSVGVELLDAFATGEGPEDEGLVLQLFEQLGIDARQTDTLSNAIGREVFYGTVMAAAMFAAAPAWATMRGTSTREALRVMGEYITRHPYATLVAEFGAAAGAATGGYLAEGQGPATEFMAQTGGALVGGGLAGAIGSATMGAAHAGGRQLGKVANALDDLFNDMVGRRLKPTPRESPLRNPDATPGDLQAWAQQTIEGDRLRLEGELQHIMRAPDNMDDSGQLSDRFFQRLTKVRERADAIDRQKWNRVPGNLNADASHALRVVAALERRFGDVASWQLPNDEMKSLKRMWERNVRAQLDEGAEMPEFNAESIAEFPLALKLDQLRILRTSTLDRLRQLPRDAGDSGRNLRVLERGLFRSMEHSLKARAKPETLKAFEEAREWTKYKHDLFTRGPIGELFATDRFGAPRVDSSEAIQKLMTRFGGQEAVERISRDERLGDLREDYYRGIVAQFYEAAEAGALARSGDDPTRQSLAAADTAARWVANPRNQKVIRQMAEVGSEIDEAARQLRSTSLQIRDLERSALAQWANTTPGKAAEWTFTRPDPAAAVRQLKAQLGRDPNGVAEQAFQAALVDEFLRRSGLTVIQVQGLPGMGAATQGRLSPMRAARTLQDPGVAAALREGLGEDAFNKLGKLVGDAARIEMGDTRAGGRIFREGSVLASRLFGAQTGRVVAQLTGGGTVQTPAMVSSAFKTTMQRALGKLDGGELLARALTDTQWEAVLSRQVPRNTDEAQELARQMGRLISSAEGLRQFGTGQLSEE